MGLRGKDDRRQRGYKLLQAGIGADGVFPDLIGIGGQVYLAVGIAVEQPGFLVLEVNHRLLAHIILEEGFVGADDFGILTQAAAHALAQMDDTLHAFGW
jgi:hypothetical protein